MRRFPQELNLHFQVGQAEQFILPAPVDLVVCNGLVGGRFFNQPGQFDGFLRSCQAALVPQGMVLLANHFHEGRRIWVEAFVRRARQAGFVVQGHWQELCLQKA